MLASLTVYGFILTSCGIKKSTLSGVDMIMPGKKHEKFRAIIAQKTGT